MTKNEDHLAENNGFLREFAKKNIPLLASLEPSIAKMDDDTCIVMIPLFAQTKNHFNSMYFGALATGADCAGGLPAMFAIEKTGVPISFIFKDFKADFLQRAEGDVHFICRQVREIAALVQKAAQCEAREFMKVHVTATVPAKNDDPVAEFELTLSVKRIPEA